MRFGKFGDIGFDIFSDIEIIVGKFIACALIGNYGRLAFIGLLADAFCQW